MNQQIWVVAASVVTVAGAYLAAKVAGRSTVTAAKIAADQGAFDRATVIYEKSSKENEARVEAMAKDRQRDLERIERLEQTAVKRDDRIASLVEELATTREDLRASQARIATLEKVTSEQAEELVTARNEIHSLRRSVAIYEGRVMQLEATLLSNGIEVPPWTMLPADADLLGIQGRGPDPNRPVRTEP